MVSKEVADFFFLYNSYYVRVVTESGEAVDGVMTGINQDTRTVTVEEREFSLEELSDIRYVGKVTDYQTYENKLIIDDRFEYEMAGGISEELYAKLRYQEFECRVSCHLRLEAGIKPCDLELFDYEHTFLHDLQYKECLLYRFADGTFGIGKLIKKDKIYTIQHNGTESEPFTRKDVVDITRLPAVNETVTVVTADGASSTGLVTAVQQQAIYMLVEGRYSEFTYGQIAQLRYEGKVTNVKTGASVEVVDGKYRCKTPMYLRDGADAERFMIGAKVSYTVGYNNQYPVAKDVVVEAGAWGSGETTEYVGIILTVDFKKEQGLGYIGNHYIAKSCGEAMRGHVVFNRTQIPFEFDFEKIFVVKYTLLDEDGSTGKIKKLAQMQLLDSFDKSKCGIIEVDEEGNVKAIPLFRAGISYFETKDVDVICKDGSIHSGILERHDDETVELRNGEPDNCFYDTVAFDDMEDIRIIGTMTQYYPNGTGRVDNTYFFHINELSSMTDARNVHPGVQVSFALRNSSKGNGCVCAEVEIIKEEKYDAYVLGYDEYDFRLIDYDKYISGDKDAEEYHISTRLYNPCRDLDSYHYRAQFTLRRRNGRRECIAVRILEKKAKVCEGYVVGIGESSITIVAKEDYGKSPESITYFLIPKPQLISAMKDLRRYDYYVTYVVCEQPNQQYAAELYSVGDQVPKVHFGYLENYYNAKNYGFITPDEYYGTASTEQRKKDNIDVFCLSTVFKNVTEPIDTGRFLYYVAYCLNYNTQDAKEPACNVRILSKIEKNAPAAPQALAPADHSEYVGTLEVPLEEKFGSTDGIPYRYAIMALFANNYDVIKTNNKFRNKRYNTEEELADVRLLTHIDTDKMDFRTEEKINTSKYVYVIRYVLKPEDDYVEDGNPMEGVDYSYPIEVLERYPRKLLKCLSVEDGMLTAEFADPNAVIMPAFFEEATESVPDMVHGESFVYKEANGNLNLGVFAERTTEGYVLQDGKVIDPREVAICRFGVITEFDGAFNMLCLNNHVKFNSSLMETKAFNIAKTGKKKFFVTYTGQGGKINRVERISPEILNLISWQSGTVTSLISSEADKEKSVVINESAKHYLSTLTDGLVNRRTSGNELLEQAVYFKQIVCPFWEDEEEYVLQTIAVEVHCAQERGTIRYDAVQDHYMAYRNNTHFVAVEGNSRALSALVDKETDVFFKIAENPVRLTAYVETDDMDVMYENVSIEEEEINSSNALMDSALGRFCLKRVDLRKMELPPYVDLNEEGWPDSEDQMRKLFVHMCCAKVSSSLLAAVVIGKRLPEDLLAAALKENRWRSLEAIMQVAFKRRIQEIAWDSNGNLGEYNYYVSSMLQEHQSESNMYRLFLQDFCSRVELGDEVRNLYMHEMSKRFYDVKKKLRKLFECNISAENAQQLISHIVALDESGYDYIVNNDLLGNNAGLTGYIIDFGKNYDSMHIFEKPYEVLTFLRETYQQDKRRFTKMFAEVGSDACKGAAELLQLMSQRFQKLMGKDDSARFQMLYDCCREVEDHRYSGFREYERSLKEAYRQICDLEAMATEHPTREVTEMLLHNDIIRKVREEIVSELDALYKDSKTQPAIICVPNEYEVYGKQTKLLLLLQNGGENVTNLQTANDVMLHLESFDLGADGVQSEVRVVPKDLMSGTTACLEVEVDLEGLEGDSFSIYWSVDYSYCAGFDGAPNRQMCRKECETPIVFQLVEKDAMSKPADARNPYKAPAAGNPLTTGEMFFGREYEYNEIWDYIVDPQEQMIPGQVVIVYGQKKCGKTSLINQITNRMQQTESVQRQAIVLNFSNILDLNGGQGGLSNFDYMLKANILDMFATEIAIHHPDVCELLEEKNLQIPDPFETDSDAILVVKFQRFFEKFKEIDGGKHKVVLIMDEFTLLCTTIIASLKEHPTYQNIPNFIKTLAGLGFIQIIIGHAAMMRALGQLGVINHTTEFAKIIELSALQPEDAIELVRRPMLEIFGDDPYKTTEGKRAIASLLDLSGCSPSVLMKLCDQMFEYYMHKKEGTQLLNSDVREMVKEYIKTLETGKFDMLLTEDGDEAEFLEKRASFLYLKHLAEESYRSNNRDCDFNVTCPDLSEADSEDMRDTLLARKVLAAGNGRIKIVMGLFAEFIRYKYGI